MKRALLAIVCAFIASAAGAEFVPSNPKEMVPLRNTNSAGHQALTSANWLSNWFRNYNSKPADQNPVSAHVIEEKMKHAHDWGQYYGRPMHVGEFGCYTAADADSRARFHREFRRILDKYDLAWALWDWKAGFHYWDEKQNAPAPGMREALFGRN